MQDVIITSHLADDLPRAVAACAPEQIFLLADTTTAHLCLPLLRALPVLHEAQEIVVAAGDSHKDLAAASDIWQALHSAHASRRALLINVGGGMITDLGGFCAATYKRGIAFINIPTTLLAMVDAAVGGKTGLNFLAVKNEIGVFREAETVVVDTTFLRTLDHANLLSGYAEMLKHGLLADAATLAALLRYDLSAPDLSRLSAMIERSLAVKQNIVAQDPYERGLRKALNLGHTIGHAIESLSLLRETPLLHGYAIAFGIVAELYLSAMKAAFPLDTLRQVVAFVRRHYGAAPLTCDDYPRLLALMQHDKKNSGGRLVFALLRAVGEVEVDHSATHEEITAALDFLREG